MPCVQCGDCSYDDPNSTADFTFLVTVAGPKACADAKTIIVTGMPYTPFSRWRKTVAGTEFEVSKDCGSSGGWTWTMRSVGPPPPPGGRYDCIRQSVQTQILQSDCAGYHERVVETFAGGSTVTREIQIEIKNNGACAT